MAIAETRKKIHFTPFDITKGRAKDTEPAPTITIAKGAMRFSKYLIQELNLNTKFVRLFYDNTKNVIGFQMKEEVKLEELKGSGRWRFLNQNPKSGQWTVQITKMMEAQFGKEVTERLYSQLPVQKYVEQSDPLARGEVYYFVELDSDKVIDSRKYSPKVGDIEAAVVKTLENITNTES